MPPNSVYVGRPTKWGNPFSIRSIKGAYRGPMTDFQARQFAIVDFRKWLIKSKALREAISELRGKDLVCWCPLDQPCHADVLLELANR